MRQLSPLLVVAFAFSLGSACTAILGIETLEDMADGGDSKDAAHSGDARPTVDATTPGDAGPTRDATTPGDTAPGSDASPDDASYPYSGPWSVAPTNGYQSYGIAVSPQGDCVAVELLSAIDLYAVDAGSLQLMGTVTNISPGDMVFDPTSTYLFAQHSSSAGAPVVGTALSACRENGNVAVPSEPGDAAATSLAMVNGGDAFLLVGVGAVGGPPPGVLAFDLSKKSTVGELLLPDAGPVGPSSIGSSVSGQVIGVVANGQVFITSVAGIMTNSAPVVVSSVFNPARVVVDTQGRRVVVLSRLAPGSVQLVQLDPTGDGGWAKGASFSLPSSDEGQLPTLTVSSEAVLVSNGDSSGPIYAFALDDSGALITPFTERSQPGPIDGLSLSLNGGVLGVSTRATTGTAGVYFADGGP